VGGKCGRHGGGERCLEGFGWEARREETTGANWIQLDQERV
jgi:hypothetical protein